jgi:exocyst complex component 3
MVHRNFEQTEEMVNNLLEMNSRLNGIEAMLSADQEDLLGPAPNLLPIHLQLTQLENFRNETMHQAKKASAESRNKLSRRFERLSAVIDAFDEYIMELSRNILPLARAGHPEVIVKVVKIAELEGKEDEKVTVIFWCVICANFGKGNCNTSRQKSG